MNEDIDQTLFFSLQNIYVQEKRKHLPHYSLPTSKGVTTAFLKACRACQEHKCDPEEYIKAQFNYVGSQLYPNGVAGSSALGNWRRYRQDNKQAPSDSYRVQLQYLQNALQNTSLSVETVLLSDRYQFEPWFRCVITKEKITSIMSKYKEKARKELDADHSLKAYLTSLNLDVGRITS